MNKLAEDETAMYALDTAFDIRIENSWSENSQAKESDDDRPLSGSQGDLDSQNLVCHLTSDSLDKPLSCSSPQIETHMRQHETHMTHAGERPFRCTQCNFYRLIAQNSW